MLLRRSGLSEDQRTLVMAQVNVDLNFDNIAMVLQLTFGQQHVLTERDRGRGRKGQGTYYETDFD
eukprot:8026530-Prorocentrum_lima.AAC.1